jgi:hypothetical protein
MIVETIGVTIMGILEIGIASWAARKRAAVSADEYYDMQGFDLRGLFLRLMFAVAVFAAVISGLELSSPDGSGPQVIADRDVR